MQHRAIRYPATALTPLYVKTRVLSGLGDGLACAEVCHDALVDLSRKEAFQASDDLAFGPAIGGASGDVVAGWLVESHADDDGSIEGGVGVSVTAPIEPMPAGGSPGRGRDRTGATQLRERGFGANPVGVIAEEDQHLGRGACADPEALTKRGRRLGREAHEVPVVRRDFLVEGDPAAGECPEGVLGGGGGCVEGARSEAGAACEESVGGEALERFSQSGRRGHDDLLQGDHRRGAGLYGRVPGDLELAHDLDGTVSGLGDRGRLARQHGPSGGLGVDRVGFAGGSA